MLNQIYLNLNSAEFVILHLLGKDDLTSHQMQLFCRAFSEGYCELNTKTLCMTLGHLMIKKYITTYSTGKLRYYRIERKGRNRYNILLRDYLLTTIGIDKITCIWKIT